MCKNIENEKVLAGLVDYHVLREDSYPCSKCSIETSHCKNLIFVDRTICVVPKEYVNSFVRGDHRGRRNRKSKNLDV